MKIPGAIAMLLAFSLCESASGSNLSDGAYVNSKSGFIDRTGKVVIPAMYKDVFWGFREGLAPVALPKQSKDVAVPGSVYGYIDVLGRSVIEPPFDRASQFSLGRVIVQVGETRGSIGRRGELISTTQDPVRIDTLEWSRGSARVLIGPAGEKVGFVDGTGGMVIPPAPMFDYGARYVEADSTLKGLSSSPQGDVAEAELYPSRAWNTAEGLTRVWAATADPPVAGHRRYGFADAAGKVVVRPKFEEVGAFSEGLAKSAVQPELGCG